MSKQYPPAMHTAEHILTGALIRKFGCGRCFSTHLNKKKSKCDFHFDQALTDAEAAELEAEVNRAVAAGVDVVETFLSIEEAGKRFALGRLPEDVESVRIVTIGEFDECPCIGEHVANTSEIGTFRLTTHSLEDGVLRIRFKLED